MIFFLPTGSPADRADLEVGDEIVEVNGQTLENATHAQVIAHIHKVRCLKMTSGNQRQIILIENLQL